MNDAPANVGDATFRDLFAYNPVPMFIYRRADMHILEGNEAAAQQYGYPRNALLTMTVHALLAPEDRWRVAEPYRAPHTGGFVRVGFRRHVRADGVALMVDVSRLDLTFRGTDAALIVALDVTARLEASRKLEETEQQLAAAEHLGRTGSFERDLHTSVIRWSAETYRITGRDPASRAPSHAEFLEMIHPDDCARYEASTAQSERGIDPAPVEYRVTRADGQVRWIETIMETVRDERGAPLKQRGTFHDVTPRHEARERSEAQDRRLQKLTAELSRQKEHLTAAQKISRTGSINRDLITGQVVWSEEARRLFGLASGAPAPLREAFLTRFHPDDRERFTAFVVSGERGQNPAPIECRIVLPTGDVRWVRNVSDTIFDDHGQPVCRIGTFQDITEVHEAHERQHELEHSLRIAVEAAEQARREVIATNVELENRVEARTAELREAQMTIVAQERLSVLGQLTATVAHEMRNPLSAINNTVFVIEEMGRSHNLPLERTVGRMKRSIARCEHIIADLLDFTRARELKLRPVLLEAWLDEFLAEQTVPAGIKLERELGASSRMMVSIDADRFRRVLINLIENAAQAIESGEGTERRITISTAGGPEPEIRVADTGPGIPPDVLPKVFEPLFSTKSFGTGLGLATANQIVGQHGGTIAIDSKPGRTVVVIRLPSPTAISLAAAS